MDYKFSKSDELALRAASSDLCEGLEKVIFEFINKWEKENRSAPFIANAIYCGLGSSLILAIAQTCKEEFWNDTLEKVIVEIFKGIEHMKKETSC